MKRELLRTMLLALIGLAWGESALNAETITISPTQTTVIQANGTSDGNTSNADENFYDATATAWRCSQSSISNGAFTNKLSSYAGSPVVITKFDASKELAGLTITKATLSFKSVCTVSGKNSNVQIALIGTNWDATTATWNNTNTADIMGAVGLNGDGTNVKTTQKTLTQDVTEQLQADEDNVLGFGIFTKTGREQEITELTLTIEAIDASASATYTVKYVDADGNEIKTADVRTESIGAETALKDEDKASIYNDDNTKKYIYTNDDSEGKAVASDNSTVVTVTFREAAIYNYVFNAVDADGNVLKEDIVKGTNFEDETFNVGYPTYVKVDSTLYKSSKLSSDGKGYYISLTLDEDNKTTDVTYSATEITGVVYYSEAEDIASLTKATNSNTGIRSSNGASAYAASEDVVFTTLPTGKYTLSTVICDASKNAGSTWNFLANNDTIFTFTASSVNWSEGTSAEFTLNSWTSITLAKGGSKNAAVDLIYIQKTGDVTSSATAVNTIAELKSLADGTDVALTLTNAKLVKVAMGGTGFTGYVEDETGGVTLGNDLLMPLYGSVEWLTDGKLINGTIYAQYSIANGMPTLSMNDDIEKNLSSVTATDPETAFVPTTITFADVTAANLARYVKIENVEMSGTVADGMTAISGTDTIAVFDKYFVFAEDYAVPAKAKSVAGILAVDAEGNYTLYPISTDDIVAATPEISTIAELKALADGTDVALKLTNAKLVKVAMGGTGFTGYVEDETGGVTLGNDFIMPLYGSAEWIADGKLINGTIYAQYSVVSGMPTLSMNDDIEKNFTSVTATDPETAFVPTTITFADVTAANLARYVKIENVEMSGTVADGMTATSGTDTIAVFDKYFVFAEDYAVPAKAKSVAGILVVDAEGNYTLYPISSDDIVAVPEQTYKEFTETTVFLPTSENVEAAIAEGWIVSANYSVTNKKGNIDPTTGETTESTKYPGVMVKKNNKGKTFIAYVTGIDELAAYGVSTGSSNRGLEITATPTDGDAISVTGEMKPSGESTVTTLSGLDKTKSYIIEFAGIDETGAGADVNLYGVKFVVSSVVTGINGINSAKIAMGNVYTISGVKVLKAGESINSLNKGLYIINGKKVVIK